MPQEISARPLRHILMTGAASGIGAACADKLKARGCTVTVVDRVEPQVQIDQFQLLDLEQEASVQAAITFAREHAPFDALLNIAGVPPRPDQALRVLNINWLAQRRFTEGVLPALQPGAAIVNMASRAGGQWRDNIEQVKELMACDAVDQLQSLIEAHDMDATRAYNLSKEAMIVWSMSLTEKLKASGIRVNSVSPAAVDTGILSDFVTAFGDRVAANLARVGRPGHPEEVADVALFLASPDSQWLRGIDVVVDGGMGAMMVCDQLGLSTIRQGD